ncbi:MAG: pyridoxal phosphate-dependent aminotransferase [Alphaproteobacteria bacterium]|nr:pyridoxal phosphate-dependent aminotransferase [Alphaproteobacteria bacterium]
MRRVIAAQRMQNVTFSASQAVIRRARELRRQGVDVIDFGTKGATPKHALDEAARMLSTPEASAYTDVRGLPALRAAIVRKLARDNGLSADSDTEILVTLGGKEGVFTALLALVDRGDEVLIEDPGWLAFEPMVRLAGATPVPVPLDETRGFRFDLDRLAASITPRTKVFILCNPHNPGGRVLSRAELEQVAALAERRDLIVIADEAYEHFVYDGRRFVSLATIDGMRERTVTVQTVSKIFNMFGWRVGWAMADKRLLEPMLAVHSHSVTCPTSFAQAGAAAVLDGSVCEDDRPIPEVVARYQAQRDAIVRGLRAIPGVSCVLPEGAYFVFANVSRFGLSSAALSAQLLETAHVATTPGSAFGALGEGHLRLVFNSPVAEIERGVARLGEALGRFGVRA